MGIEASGTQSLHDLTRPNGLFDRLRDLGPVLRPGEDTPQVPAVSRAIAATKASTSSSVVSKEHIQRTSFFVASQS